MSTWIALLQGPAFGTVPLAPAPDCTEERQDLCHPDVPDDWDLISWIPEPALDSVRPEEVAIGSGLRADVAFRSTTGRWDVPVAVMDSGIEWDEGELINKVLLNVDELPVPQLADGTAAPGHDVDGNGLVNIADYAQDARVDWTAGVDAGDGWLDPGDLIATFSDGVDDDGNGYVDDIAGWDFFAWDNDPYAVPGGSAYHGSGVMRNAAAEGGNGGSIGTCPGCSILPIRIGDGFITDGDRIAMAIAYATDRGARAIGMAIGGLTLPESVYQAVAYADAHGVVLVANPGDENSYHRNLPGVVDPILYVHSVRSEGQNETSDDVYSFLNFHNCNNYSPRLDLVAPGECGTGATGRITGAAALVIAAGLDVGVDLEAVEVRGLLTGTAIDVDLPPDESEQADTYPSDLGWDGYYGYGRVDLGAAVEAVRAGDIPPVARFTSPDWFAWTSGTIRVEGEVRAPHDEVASWTLDVGVGVDPREWATVTTGSGEVEGLLAEVSPDTFGLGGRTFAPLDGETVMDRYARAHEPLATFRLTVEDSQGRAVEVRRGVWVHDDPDLLPGFPITLPSSTEASVVLADLDGDGVLEAIVAASDGSVHAYRGDATEAPGFPAKTSASPRLSPYAGAEAYASGALDGAAGDGIVATPAVGDIDGDGTPEVVVATLRGRVFAWHNDGALVDGFPVSIVGRTPEELQLPDRAWDDGVMGAPALGDVDGDGALEIVAAASDQRLYVWSGGGALRDGFPIELCDRCDELGARIIASPSLGDVDADGHLDAVVGTNEIPVGATGLLWFVDLVDARVWDGAPIERSGLINQSILPVLGEGHPSSVALADLDGDGDLELASYAMLSTSGPIHHDGTELFDIVFAADGYGDLANFEDGSFLSLVTNPAFGDMDLDGAPDLMLGGASVLWVVSLALADYVEFQQAFGGWSGATGEALPGFPRQVDDISFLAAPAIAEITGDVLPEAFFGTGGYFLNAWNYLGTPAPGWPKFTGGWILGGPAVGDIDGDGYHDVALTTRDGRLFAWKTRGSASVPPQWAAAHHDAANTGNYDVPLPVQAGPDAAASGGCCGKGGLDETALLVLPLLVFAGRRRRER
jgi:hypothetical protein